MYARNVLYSGFAGGASIWVGYVVHVHTYQEESGRVPPPGGMETDREDAAAYPGWDMNVILPGGGDFGDRRAGGGDLCSLPPEHRRDIYRAKAHYGPVSGGGMTVRILFIKAVARTGDTISREDTGGGSGGRDRNGLRGFGGRGGGGRDG